MKRLNSRGRLFTDLVLEVFRINGRLLADGDRLLRPFRQTSSRWQVLGAVATSAMTVPGIGRRMGISRQSVQRTSDLLVKEGYCAFSENPDHQKSPLLSLTAKGKTLLQRISPVQAEWANDVASVMSEQALTSALKTLRELSSQLAKTNTT